MSSSSSSSTSNSSSSSRTSVSSNDEEEERSVPLYRSLSNNIAGIHHHGSMARVLSIAFLLVSCAPLASLYAVMWDSNASFPSLLQHSLSNSHDERSATMSSGSKRNNNSPNGSRRRSRFGDYHHSPSSNHHREDNVQRNRSSIAVFWNHYTPTARHWTIIVPWSISLFFGLVLPFVLSCISHLQQQQQPQPPPITPLHTTSSSSAISTRESRQEQRYRLIAQEVRHQCKTFQATSSSSTSTSSNCSICLTDHENGDYIVQGLNCHHVFHYQCVIPWLAMKRFQEESKPCPCCRQVFCQPITTESSHFSPFL